MLFLFDQYNILVTPANSPWQAFKGLYHLNYIQTEMNTLRRIFINTNIVRQKIRNFNNNNLVNCNNK